MKVLAALIILIVIVCVFCLMASAYNKWKARNSRWTVVEHNKNGHRTLTAMKAGESSEELAKVPLALPSAEFSSRLWEARSEAYEKLTAMNSK